MHSLRRQTDGAISVHLRSSTSSRSVAGSMPASSEKNGVMQGLPRCARVFTADRRLRGLVRIFFPGQRVLMGVKNKTAESGSIYACKHPATVLGCAFGMHGDHCARPDSSSSCARTDHSNGLCIRWSESWDGPPELFVTSELISKSGLSLQLANTARMLKVRA